MPRRFPRLVAWGSIAALSVAVAVAAVTSSLSAHSIRHLPSAVTPASTTQGGTGDLYALERDGNVQEVVPNDGAAWTLARGAAPDDGIAEVPDRKAIFFTTGLQQSVCPSVAMLSLTDPSVPKPVIPDAELPSVSPDGSFLAFATTNDACAQDGVGIVRIDSAGSTVGDVQRFLDTNEPPALPITAVTVSRDGAQIAFAGGLVDPVLGPLVPTVYVLHTSTATSLESARALVDTGTGVSPSIGSAAGTKLEFGTPVFAPIGILLVSSPTGVPVLFSGAGGLTVETVRSGALPLESVALGPGADVAFVNSAGDLLVGARRGWVSSSPLSRPSNLPSVKALGYGYAAVAWTPGPSAISVLVQ